MCVDNSKAKGESDSWISPILYEADHANGNANACVEHSSNKRWIREKRVQERRTLGTAGMVRTSVLKYFLLSISASMQPSGRNGTFQ